MTLPLSINPSARDEVDDAFWWYERRSPGLGGDFLAAVRDTLKRIASNPAIYGRTNKDIRSGPVHRFPFAVHYRVRPTHVRILAVQHTSRNWKSWLRRI